MSTYTVASGARGSKSRHEPSAQRPSARRTSRAPCCLRISIARRSVPARSTLIANHAPAARLERMLDARRVIAAGAHLRHGAGERADVGAETRAERNHHHAELVRSDPAQRRAEHGADRGAGAAPTPAPREPSLDDGASPPTGVIACCPEARRRRRPPRCAGSLPA
jgi:hypothetical protein